MKTAAAWIQNIYGCEDVRGRLRPFTTTCEMRDHLDRPCFNCTEREWFYSAVERAEADEREFSRVMAL